jgi:ATP-dependent DNA helicase DinG
VPALRWAAANKERTIVSTNTINLQEQLVGKDLPFLAKALNDQPVRFALLKGWRNYICRVRLEQATGGAAQLFDDGMAREVAALKDWADRTKDGSLADLPTPPRPEVWDEVSAEPDVCTRMKCAHFEDCFLFKGAPRGRAGGRRSSSTIICCSRTSRCVGSRRTGTTPAVLPAYGRLVVDEGASLEMRPRRTSAAR